MKCLSKDARFHLRPAPRRSDSAVLPFHHMSDTFECLESLHSSYADDVFCVFLVFLGSFPDVLCSQWQTRCYCVLTELAGRQRGSWPLWAQCCMPLLFSILTHPAKKLYVALDLDHRSCLLTIKYLAHTHGVGPVLSLCFWSMFLIYSTSSKVLHSVFSAAVGEATDDGEREEEDHVLGHLPRHRHHLRGVVAVRSHRQNGRWNQTRSVPGSNSQTQT